MIDTTLPWGFSCSLGPYLGRAYQTFVTDMVNAGTWEDLQGSYPNGAAAISFADGHSELHYWQRAAARARMRMVSQNGTWSDAPASVDLAWVTNHGSDTITGE